MLDKDKLEPQDIYKEFCENSPQIARMITTYEKWGSRSIAVWLSNGLIYKVTRYDYNKFSMQELSKEDIKKKFKR